jgi:hypothetical protein
MADKTPEERFTEAIESISKIVLHEFDLIDIDLEEQLLLHATAADPLQSEAELRQLANDDKAEFLAAMRKRLERVIEKFALERQGPWRKVDAAFNQRFPEVAEQLAARASSGAPPAPAPVRGFALCPPGFEEIDGICVRIVTIKHGSG